MTTHKIFLPDSVFENFLSAHVFEFSGIYVCSGRSLTMAETITSAPAKVILFGEHLVVHGATALTTALDLRTYVRLSALQGEVQPLIHINLPDIKADVKIPLADLKYTGMWR